MRQPQSGSSPARQTGDRTRSSRRGRDAGDRRSAESTPDTPAKRTRRRRARRTRRSRRLPSSTGLVVMVIALAAAYGVYWMVVANMVQSGIEAWAAQQEAQGVTMSFRSARVGGFPGTVTARLTAVSTQASVAHGAWSWQTPSLAVEVNPLTPFAVTLDLGLAPHAIRIPVGSTAVALTAMAETARLRLDSSNTRLTSAELTLESARLGADALEGDAYTLDALSARFDAVGPAEPEADDVTQRVSAMLSGLSVPAAARLPLGRDIAAARLEARVLGPLPQDRPLDTALAAWRDDGGSLLLDILEVDWPPLSVQATGQVVLDHALQPESVLRARIVGFVPAVDALREERLVRSADATMAKVLLTSLARPAPDGDLVLDLAVVIRDGTLWVGPVALMPMPRMPWGPPRGSLGDVGIRPGFSLDREGNVVPK
ncbi:DUF2125 domain-containing protein [Roseospira visakhapatnamensis]|uniref:DUF2125 domain-containing protein n=1 Tax=Roseospira visakhapatnamensis TaxID=390880 RepID=A0A7W6WAD8_9PROT|nr:DUF2125 domain-containing protein [Roseospira visakhapatnamensis]MBB4266748.1 hypothetical protein [Roseospira visakhapatnamensis]